MGTAPAVPISPGAPPLRQFSPNHEYHKAEIMTDAQVHRVRFEPVGIEMEVEEGETVLDAAFRQGISLMHGCKEGQCGSCKSKLIEGDIELLERLSETAQEAALCALGKSAPNPFLSTLRYFRDEYEAHINDKRCPSNCCKELLLWEVVEDKCVKCGACKKACPVDAIVWEKGQIAFLDKDKCTKCKSCYDACRFMAIE
jgi:ferredoxin